MGATFRLVCAAFAISRLGDFLYNTSLVVVVLQRTGSAHWVALAVLARILPFVALTPFASVVADRVDRRRLMVTSDAGRAVVMIAAAVVVHGQAPVPVLLAVAMACSCLGTPFFAALTATVPDVVPANRLPVANAALSTTEYAAAVAGPTAAAGLLATGHDSLPFALNAATFGVSAILLSGVRIARRTRVRVEESGSLLRGAAVGVRVLLRHRLPRLSAFVRWAVAFSLGTQVALLPLVSRDLIGTGDAGLGLLEACLGLGGMLGGVVAARVVRTGRTSRAPAATALAVAVPMAVLAVATTAPVAYGLLLAQGAATGVLTVQVVTLLQRHAPGGRLARIDGLLASAGLAVGLAGTATGAALLEVAGLRPALALGSLAAAAGGVISLTRGGRTTDSARIDQLAPEAGDPTVPPTEDLPAERLSAGGGLGHDRRTSGRGRGRDGNQDVPVRGPGRLDRAAHPAG